ncbi:MAG TPA: hypothetical protein VFR81_03560 [Longimicrobium sp.]|nr:hypothetical protein [Longimicrobium sp.]
MKKLFPILQPAHEGDNVTLAQARSALLAVRAEAEEASRAKHGSSARRGAAHAEAARIR